LNAGNQAQVTGCARQGEGGAQFGFLEIEYVTLAVAAEPVTPAGSGGIAILNVKSDVCWLKSTAGRVIVVMLGTASDGPLRTIVPGSVAMFVTR
jgi:hypothetical protein